MNDVLRKAVVEFLEEVNDEEVGDLSDNALAIALKMYESRSGQSVVEQHVEDLFNEIDLNKIQSAIILLSDLVKHVETVKDALDEE